MNKLTESSILSLGFTLDRYMYTLVLNDVAPISNDKLYNYRSLVIIESTEEKGKFILFIKQGWNNNRKDDGIIDITSNLEYLEDLVSFIRICSL